LLLIFSLSFVLSGCSAIGELKTETIVKNYLESDDGPENVIAQSFDKLIYELNNNTDDNLNDYEWDYKINNEKVNIVDAKSDSDGSGILTVKNIVLVYDYTITGDHKNDNSKSFSRNGELYYNISELIYDDNSENLKHMSQAKAKRQSNSLSPILSKIEPNYDNGFSLKVEIDNYSSGSVLGVISLGDRDLSDSQSNHALNISDDQLSIDPEFSLGETNFASILVINYDKLIESPLQTGLAAALIAVP
ncbi:MAG: hypothetical protein ABR547_10565, partial [Halanaerobium sp.]